MNSAPNSGSAADVLAVLGAWRERGLRRLDPVGFRLIEALAARAAVHDGDARRILEARLAELLASYESRAASAAAQAYGDGKQAEAGQAAASPLAELLAYIDNRKPAVEQASRHGRSRAAYAEIAELDYFRQAWLKVNTRRQLRHSREQVPENAGPLNSDSLVHRSMSLMRELAPGYLHHFLSYLDALAWMEQLGGAGADRDKSPQREPQRRGGARKTARPR